MRIGMLWFDDDPKSTLTEKVRRAATHYERKYGRLPDLCFVHRSAFNGNGKRRVINAGGVEIRPGRTVLPDHFWLGQGDDDEPAK